MVLTNQGVCDILNELSLRGDNGAEKNSEKIKKKY